MFSDILEAAAFAEIHFLTQVERMSSSNSSHGKRRRAFGHHRHDASTVARLEEMFSKCPNPTEAQRRKMSEELGLESRQVKFWYQNKKTLVKTQIERFECTTLRLENNQLLSENLKLRETSLCVPCGGPDPRAEEHELSLRALRAEYLLLTKEYESKLAFLKNMGIDPGQLHALTSSHDTEQRSLPNQTVGIPNQHTPNLDHVIPARNQVIPNLDHQIPVPGQHIPVPGQHIPIPDQPIPVDAPTQAFSQDFSDLTHDVNQDILAFTATPTLSQNIPSPNPGYVQDIPALISDALTTNGLDPFLHQNDLLLTDEYDMEALFASLEQNSPPKISTHDQNNNNIPIAEQEIQVPTPGGNIPSPNPTMDKDTPPLGQNIPPLGQNIPALGNNQMPSPYIDLKAILGILNNNMGPPPVMNQTPPDMENALMWQIANNAMDELMKLLKADEPLWFRSILDGKFILQRDMYQRTFGKINCLTGTHARIESSKDSLIVNMSATQLKEMFLNSDKWIDLFPTIVKKAQTLKVFESGLVGNRNGALQLMNAELHIISNLVPTREFLFLRYCKQIQEGVWAIGDVSVDSSKYKTTGGSRVWKLPSGCLIQEISQGLCKVSWVEHVEVDDMIQTHPLFRDAICGGNAYGAERWVLTLERMCERFACFSDETIPIPSSEAGGGVITSLEGKRSVMNLSQRMVKIFLENLTMKDDGSFPHLTRMNNGEVRLSARVNNTNLGLPRGMILCAATTFWLPFSPQYVFDFLMDMKTRAKWDVLCNGNTPNVVQRISTGSNPGNCISIMWPFIPQENSIMVLQETYADTLGSMLVYTPLSMEVMNFSIKGADMSLLPLLPSGITISGDGHSNVPEKQSEQVGDSGGSLVTVMSQVLASSPSQMGTIDMKFVDHVKAHVTLTAEQVKAAVNCSNLK